VLDTPNEEKRKREELKAKRDQLFDRYLKHPMDTRLALEIKAIDDQIAEHAGRKEAKARNRT
jgi:hypothetical protein